MCSKSLAHCSSRGRKNGGNRERKKQKRRERGQGIEGRAKHTQATLRNDKHPQDARLGSACVAKPQWLENGQSLSPRVNGEILLP